MGFGNVAQVLRALGVLDLVVTAADPLESDIGRLRARERDCFTRNQDDDGVDRSQAGPGNRIPGHNNGRPIEPRICTMLRIG